jgi:hypothetical protein
LVFRTSKWNSRYWTLFRPKYWADRLELKKAKPKLRIKREAQVLRLIMFFIVSLLNPSSFLVFRASAAYIL